MNSFYRFFPIALVLAIAAGALSPAWAQGESSLQKKSSEFLNASTQEAKVIMSQFSNAELTELVEQWKSKLSLQDQRKLWFVKELEERRADSAAADRLLYVFLAVFLTVILILIFVISIYRTYRRIEKELE